MTSNKLKHDFQTLRFNKTTKLTNTNCGQSHVISGCTKANEKRRKFKRVANVMFIKYSNRMD